MSASRLGPSGGTPPRAKACLGGKYSINAMSGMHPTEAQNVGVRLCHAGGLRILGDTEYPPFILDKKRSLVIKFDLGNSPALTATDIRASDPTNSPSVVEQPINSI